MERGELIFWQQNELPMVGWLFAVLWSSLPSILAQGVTPRIVGGSAVGSSSFPYFVRWGGCGATLIHNDIALGAAHVSQRIVVLVQCLSSRSRLTDFGSGMFFVTLFSSPSCGSFADALAFQNQLG